MDHVLDHLELFSPMADIPNSNFDFDFSFIFEQILFVIVLLIYLEIHTVKCCPIIISQMVHAIVQKKHIDIKKSTIYEEKIGNFIDSTLHSRAIGRTQPHVPTTYTNYNIV